MFFQLHQHAHNYSRQKVWHKSTSKRLAEHVEQMNCIFPQLHCMFPQLHQHVHVVYRKCDISRPAKGWLSSCLIGTWRSLRCACCSNLCGTICWRTTRSRSVWWRDRWPTWRRASSSSASPASWSTPPTLWVACVVGGKYSNSTNPVSCLCGGG